MRVVSSRELVAAVLVFLVAVSMSGLSVALAEEPNVGLLRVSDVRHPRQVAPAAQVSFVIDVEYAIRFNATVRTSLFDGSPGNLGAELWHSDPLVLSAGGDQLWTANLTAPSSEGEWTLTAFAYYFEKGEWKYFTDPDQGPGFAQTKLKVAPLAALEIDLGLSDIPVKVDGSTARTSSLGTVTVQLPVGVAHQITVQLALLFDNSTRMVFAGWQDGSNDTQRTLILDGDLKISGSYRTQYLLRVSSVLSAYSYSEWYDAGSNITLRADDSVPMSGVFGTFGLRYVFRGWSGDIESTARSVTLIVNKPSAINANFDVDYTPIVILAILLFGIVGGAMLAVLRKRRSPTPTAIEEEVEDEPVGVCGNCGEPIEESWTHCVHCGKALGSSESVQS